MAMSDDVSLDQILSVIQIYSGLPREQILEEIRARSEKWKREDRLSGIFYGAIEYSIPIDLYPEILKLGRRLDQRDIDILRAEAVLANSYR